MDYVWFLNLKHIAFDVILVDQFPNDGIKLQTIVFFIAQIIYLLLLKTLVIILSNVELQNIGKMAILLDLDGKFDY